MSESWDRQDKETSQQFEAFTVYRDLGPGRSTAQVATRTNLPYKRLASWSAKWAWVARAAAYDDEQDRQWRGEVATKRRDMARRHARLASALQAKVVERIRTLEAHELTPASLGQLLDLSARLERGAWGEPDTHVVHTGPAGGPVQITNVSDEERRARMDLLARELQRRLED